MLLKTFQLSYGLQKNPERAGRNMGVRVWIFAGFLVLFFCGALLRDILRGCAPQAFDPQKAPQNEPSGPAGLPWKKQRARGGKQNESSRKWNLVRGDDLEVRPIAFTNTPFTHFLAKSGLFKNEHALNLLHSCKLVEVGADPIN